MNKIVGAAFSFLLLCSPTVHPANSCDYDKDAMLALDERSFDQDLAGGGGWRSIEKIPGCEIAAADLLAAYQRKHMASGSILAWHEGQMRASGGQYKQAIPLLESARKPVDRDPAGWNYYVDASVAFLQHDKPALLLARQRLAAVTHNESSGIPPLKNGYVEFPAQPGQPVMRMRWPPNIDVVDAFVRCFDKPYSEAYGASCRASSP